MNENLKAEAEKTWNSLKPSVEALVGAINALYTAAGSSRKCRQINQLWHPEAPGIGLGFVPPEVRGKLDVLLEVSGLHTSKANGPLGHGAYFSLTYDSQLTEERLARLAEMVTKEAGQTEPVVKVTVPAEALIEEQVARVEGMHMVPKEKIRTRPSEVGPLVDAFNSATTDMKLSAALKLLADALPYFNLPDDTRTELLRTVTMLHAAETF